jgi:hypothetical protein
MRRSLLIFAVLVGYLIFVKFAVSIFQIQFAHPSQEQSFSWTVIAIISVLGVIGILASARTGFPGFWDPNITVFRKLIVPLIAGLLTGLIAIAVDSVFGLSKTVAAKMGTESVHIPFPSSAFVYPAAAILVSVFQYLIPIPILVWIISNVILRGRFQEKIFWIIGILAALVEPFSQAAMLKGIPSLPVVAFILVFAANLVQLYLFRKSGFLSTVFYRLFFYVVWHIAGSAFS